VLTPEQWLAANTVTFGPQQPEKAAEDKKLDNKNKRRARNKTEK